MSIEYGLAFTLFSAQFDIPYSIFFVQVTLTYFSKFEIITLFLPINFFLCQKKTKKRFLIAKLFRVYVRRVSEVIR